MPAGSWIYERTTPTGGSAPPPFVPPDAPPVTINRAEVREIYDGQFEVSVFWAPHALATADNFRGVAIFVEDPDISEKTQAPMNGTVQLNGTAQTSGRWAPVRMDDSFTSPAVILVDGDPVARKIRIYCQAFGKVTNATLVRANKPSPTPSVQAPIPAMAGLYVSGQEYAWVITNPQVIVVTDWDNPSGPVYHLTFDLTEPTDKPLPPGLKDFAGVKIVYEYPNGARADGPFLESKKTDTWFSQDYDPGGGGTYRVYFVSVDVEGRINTIVREWTPYVDITITYPPAGQPSAPYVTGFTLANPRHEWQPDGSLIAKADLTWVPPTSPRYAMVNFYRIGVTPPKWLGQAGGKSTGFTLSVLDWPKVAEAWTIVAISTDFNGKQSDDPAAPSASAPRVTWNIGPPALGTAGGGIEYTPIGGASGAAVSTEQVLNSDGVVMMRHIIAGWTNPTDNSFGGMSIARLMIVPGMEPVANATYWDAPKNATTFTTDWEPAPAARTWDFYFVSRDMQGRRNSLNPAVTPKVAPSHAFTPMPGNVLATRLPKDWFNEAEFEWPAGPGGLFTVEQIVAPKIFVGSILRVGGGPTAVGTDGAFKGFQNGQIAVYNSGNVLRAWMGQQDGIATPDIPTPHSVFGGWFTELYVGGLSPVTAPLYAKQDGTVIVGGFDVAGGRYPYISIRDNTNTEVGRMGARIGYAPTGNQPGPELTIQGAWFRELAMGGQSFTDWRVLSKMDASSPLGASLQIRNVNKLTVDYLANYNFPTSNPNAAIHLEFGYDSFFGGVPGDNRYYKFPGFIMVRTGTTFGITVIDRGLILRDSYGGRLVSLVMYNGDNFGGDAGVFYGSLTMQSAYNPNLVNVYLESGSTGGAHPGAPYFKLLDEYGNLNFQVDQIGAVTIRGTAGISGKVTCSDVVQANGGFNGAGGVAINASGQFVSGAGVNTTAVVRADAGFNVGGFGGSSFGTFTTVDGKTVTVRGGIITSIA